MVKVYGIPNCDSVKKSLLWLKKHNITFHFHNLKEDGISAEKLRQWVNKAGMEIVLNKKSTAWRNLNEMEKSGAGSQSGAIKMMQEQTNMIKRPVIENKNQLVVGFNEEIFLKFLNVYG